MYHNTEREKTGIKWTGTELRGLLDLILEVKPYLPTESKTTKSIPFITNTKPTTTHNVY